MENNRLTWTEATPGDSPVAGYRLYNADNDALIIQTTALEYLDGPKAPGTYRYYVVAYADDGQVSPRSNTLVLVVVPGIIDPPEAVVLSGELNGDDADLSWTTAVAGTYPVAGYNVYRSVNSGAFALLTTVSAPTTTYQDTTLVSPNTYGYRVVVLDTQDNVSPDSNTVEVDSAFNDVVILIQAHTGTLVEVSGLPTLSVVGAGVVSGVDPKFGVGSFRNPGNNTAALNYVRIQDSDGTLFIYPGEFTWEGWFKLVSYNTDTFSNFFANRINFPTTGFLQLAVRNPLHNVLFNSSPSGGFNTVPPPEIPLDEWFHIAVTRDASNVMNVWLMGVSIHEEVQAGTMGGTVAGVSAFDVCRGQAGDNSDLNCYFDQVRVTKRCRYTDSFEVPSGPFPSSG